MGLSKKELSVLNVCDKEPGSIKWIRKQLGLPAEGIASILNKLRHKGLVYKDDEIKGGLWTTTLAGAMLVDK